MLFSVFQLNRYTIYNTTMLSWCLCLIQIYFFPFVCIFCYFVCKHRISRAEHTYYTYKKHEWTRIEYRKASTIAKNERKKKKIEKTRIARHYDIKVISIFIYNNSSKIETVNLLRDTFMCCSYNLFLRYRIQTINFLFTLSL